MCESINSRPLLKQVVFFMAQTVGTFLIFASIMTLAACVPVEPTTPQATHSEIQAFFTPGPDCENHIIAAINNAQKMDIAVYSITNPAIANSVIMAYNRGADVRVITDRTQANGKGSLVGKIRDAGIPVVTNIRHKIEHNKFAVFDDVRVVSGSYNWTTNASKYNSENCLFFDQPDKEFSERFNYLWNLYNN